jgi:hypothetical protein
MGRRCGYAESGLAGLRKSAPTQSYGRRAETGYRRSSTSTFAFPQALRIARLAPGAPLLEQVRDPRSPEAAAGGGSARSLWMHARHGIHTLYELASWRIRAFAKSPSPFNWPAVSRSSKTTEAMWETNNEPSRGGAITKYDKRETHYHARISGRWAPEIAVAPPFALTLLWWQANRGGWHLSRLIFLARAIIIAAIIADCFAIGVIAYRWFVFSEVPGVKTWSGLVGLTVFVVYALIRAHDHSKE